MTTVNLPIAQRVAHLSYSTAPLVVRSAALVLIGAALLAISAKIQIPFYPALQTLQTMIVLLGLLWLGNLIGWNKLVLQFGMLSFLLGDALKIIFAAVALSPIVNSIRRSDDDE